MGPNSDDRNVMKALAENGMDVARFNFSHGTHEEQKARLDMLKSVRDELDLPIAALLDTKGPEIRTGLLKDGNKVTLVSGQTFVPVSYTHLNCQEPKDGGKIIKVTSRQICPRKTWLMSRQRYWI